MNNLISGYAAGIPTFVIFALALAALTFGVRAFLPIQRRSSITRTILIWVLASWFTGMLMVTLLLTSGSPNPGNSGPQIELIPFVTLLENGPGLGGIALAERAANVVMFIPGGFLATLVMNWSVKRTAFAFLVVGIAVETAQLFMGARAVTTEDVLWALLGGTLGALLALPIKRRLQLGELDESDLENIR